MKKTEIFITFIALFVLLSCDPKIRDYTSISGSWRCLEINPIEGQKVYMVDIDRKRTDTTQYLMSNFQNQGIDEFAYALLIDSTITIPQQALGIIIVKSGNGMVSADFKHIELNYTIFDGQNDFSVNAYLTRPE